MRMRTVVDGFVCIFWDDSVQSSCCWLEAHPEYGPEAGKRNQVILALLRSMRALELIEKCANPRIHSSRKDRSNPNGVEDFVDKVLAVGSILH